MRTLRLVLFSLAACFSFVAHAACVYYTTGYTGATRFGSASAACTAAVSKMYSGVSGVSGVVDSSTSTLYCAPRSGSNPPNPGSMFVISKNTDPNCNQCSAAAGEISTMNVTRGWARSPLANKADQLGATSVLPSSICNGGCRFSVLGNEAAYRSQVPSSSGLYRLSSDVTVIQTDQSCTESEASLAASPSAPNKPCPGTLGELNGKPYCAVSDTTSGVQPVGPPGNELDDKGNPSAGPKPSSGEGSGLGGVGRTPTTGSGGNSGGPAAAATGGAGVPGPTVPKPADGKEQAACGAPGQPKCGIDEGGTPSKFDGDKAALDGWKSTVEANRNTIKDADGGFFNSFNLFFSAPPVVACEPIELPNEQVITRHCDVVEGTRSVMSYLWALAAIWLCLGWIREAI